MGFNSAFKGLTCRRSTKLYVGYIVPFLLYIYTYLQLSVEERQTQLFDSPSHLNPHIKRTEMFHIKTNSFMNKQSHKVDEYSDGDRVHCDRLKLVPKQLFYNCVYLFEFSTNPPSVTPFHFISWSCPYVILPGFIGCFIWLILKHIKWAFGIRLLGGMEILVQFFNPLKPELNPICYLLALLGAHHFLHVSRIRVNERQWLIHISLWHWAFDIVWGKC